MMTLYRSAHNNRHSGTLPKELSVLRRLQVLYVSSCPFRLFVRLFKTPLPFSVRVCPPAWRLLLFPPCSHPHSRPPHGRRLGHNAGLTGTISGALSSLTALHTLYACLAGAVPDLSLVPGWGLHPSHPCPARCNGLLARAPPLPYPPFESVCVLCGGVLVARRSLAGTGLKGALPVGRSTIKSLQLPRGVNLYAVRRDDADL